MGIKQSLLACIPDAYYSDGTKASCLMYRIFNMFDIDSQSFKEVHGKKDMEKMKLTKDMSIYEVKSYDKGFNANRLFLGGTEIAIEDGKVIVKK